MMSPFSWTVNAFGCTCRSIRACTTLSTHLHPPSTLLAGVVLPHQTSTCIAFVKAAPTQLSWLRAARRRGRSWRAAWRIQHILTAVNPFIPIKLFFLILLRECVPASFPEKIGDSLLELCKNMELCKNIVRTSFLQSSSKESPSCYRT